LALDVSAAPMASLATTAASDALCAISRIDAVSRTRSRRPEAAALLGGEEGVDL
jgi:hypothetical protein